MESWRRRWTSTLNLWRRELEEDLSWRKKVGEEEQEKKRRTGKLGALWEEEKNERKNAQLLWEKEEEERGEDRKGGLGVF